MNYLIVGLGNPGPEYELTRHNIGFLVLDRLADKHNAVFAVSRHGHTAIISHKGRKLTLLKPNTYMNLSGKAVNYHAAELKTGTERLLVITDDIVLPFGKMRLKAKGSAGGHNGLKSIEETMHTQEYARLRMGVGGDFAKGAQADYVLSPFPAAELNELPAWMDRAGEAVLSFCFEGVERAMNKFN